MKIDPALVGDICVGASVFPSWCSARADEDALQEPSSPPTPPTSPALRLSLLGSPLPPLFRSSTGTSTQLGAGRRELTRVWVLSFCSSGLMAVQAISNSIRNGEIEIGYAIGFESMSAKCVLPRSSSKPLLTPSPSSDSGASSFCDDIMSHPVAKDCVYPYGFASFRPRRLS